MNRINSKIGRGVFYLGFLFLWFMQSGTCRLPHTQSLQEESTFRFTAPVDSVSNRDLKSGSVRMIPAIVIGTMNGL
ncbi:hypothetical protein [Natronoflexus pectinivorans]|uniref:Uncharacterized protein n=1 Tax=Natronoflexus pectinivorans TaxID=682526 RepID=A0A4R2GJ28_9BACT|nr:hypothetical protein [Natronoflexus pectinivorans]TCO08303.1 hypothetical protein EV194_105107 [Natronoflexus pectinivorans]